VKPEKEDHIYTLYEYRKVPNLPMKALTIFLTLLILVSKTLAQNNPVIVYSFANNFEDSIQKPEWMNPNTISLDEPNNRNHFSRMTAASPYSSGIEVEIPGDLRRTNFRISVQGIIRIANSNSNNQVVISISNGDSAIFWKGMHVPDSTGKINAWNPFIVSTLVPRSIPVKSKIKIFLWNSDGKDTADVDDLEIKFTEVAFPSFLPK